MSRLSLLALAPLLVATACGGAARPTVRMAPIVVPPTLPASETAEALFRNANARVTANDCAGAVVLFDRVATEHASSDLAPPALYNAGLCLEDANDLESAERHFGEVVARYPESNESKYALLLRAWLLVRLARWDDAVAVAETTLARTDLSLDERAEAMSRRAQAHLGAARLEETRRTAQEALTFYRTHQETDERVHDEQFGALASFCLAEVHRLSSERIEIPAAEQAVQRAALDRRAQHLLDAQRQYFDTIRLGDPHWSSASGYRIGQMYDGLWQAVTTSPAPPRPDLGEEARRIFNEEYTRHLVELVRPLLRHAVRYWELTLMMVERSGARSDWVTQTRNDLERVRARLAAEVAAESLDRNAPATATPATANAPDRGAALAAPR